MPAVLLTLCLLAVAGLFVARAVRNVESSARVVAEVDTDRWGARAAQLREATGELRDAVDLRQPR